MQEIGTKFGLHETKDKELKQKKVSGDKDMKKTSYLIVKRVIDVLASFLGVFILSPVFLILGLAVKIDSKGPAFFAHKRLGKNGNIINVYKFRTMVTNAEEILRTLPEDKKKEFEINFKFDDDPRVTKLGKFLRESSLDELPQILNILKGDMSIVGPRPIVQDELKMYGEYAEKLLSVKPGLTGYWQANGRSDTTYDERVAMDMYYIDKQGIIFDFNIILKTIVSVFKKEGAR